MFTQPCFIEITPDIDKEKLIEKAKQTGYLDFTKTGIVPEKCTKTYLCCSTNGNQEPVVYISHYKPADKFIDCGNSQELFIALMHCSDDEYFNLYYMVIDDAYEPRYMKGQLYKCLCLMSTIHPSCYRPATPEEIINHLNKS